MANTKFAGARTDIVGTGGGSVRMTVASNVAQGNGGTSLPCRKVWIIADAATVRVRIDTACTATTGIPIPWLDAGDDDKGGSWGALEIPIDDVSKLYFYGSSDGENVDCLYLT